MLLRVAESHEIEAEKPFIITMEGRRLCIIRGAGGLYCIEDHCPHQQRSLEDGTVKGNRIVCPYHGVEFDFAANQITNDMGFIYLSDIKEVRVVEKDNQVYVELNQD